MRGGPLIRIEARCPGCMYYQWRGNVHAHCKRMDEPIKAEVTPSHCPLLAVAIEESAKEARKNDRR